MFHFTIRKRAAEETGGVGTNGDYNSQAKSSRVVKQDNAIHEQVVDIFEKESMGSESYKEGSAVPISKDQAQAFSDIPQPQKVRILVLLYLVVNKLAGHSWLMALYIG